MLLTCSNESFWYIFRKFKNGPSVHFVNFLTQFFFCPMINNMDAYYGWSYTITFGSCMLVHLQCTVSIKLAFSCTGQVTIFLYFVLIGLFGNICQFELIFTCFLERNRFIIDDLIVCCVNVHTCYYAHFLHLRL